jgi:hypothetical protein
MKRIPISSPRSPQPTAINHRSYNVSEHRQGGSSPWIGNGIRNAPKPLGGYLDSFNGLSFFGVWERGIEPCDNSSRDNPCGAHAKVFMIGNDDGFLFVRHIIVANRDLGHTREAIAVAVIDVAVRMTQRDVLLIADVLLSYEPIDGFHHIAQIEAVLVHHLSDDVATSLT